MATITKTGPHQYKARVRRAGYPPQTQTFETKPAAEAWARDIESRMDKGAFIDKGSWKTMTLDDLMKRYGEEETPSKKGAVQEQSKLRTLRAQPIAKMRLTNIEPGDIVDFRVARLTEVAPATVTKEMNLISGIFHTAASEWKMRGLVNPVTGIKRPIPPKPRTRRLEEIEDRSELTWILQATQSEHLRRFVPIAIETAMRRGEMTKIAWSDVSLTDATIDLFDTKNGENRTVPLSSRAIEILKNMPRRADGDVFTIKPNSVTQAFIRARRRARGLYEADCKERGKTPNSKFLMDLKLHDMRHEASSRFSEMDLKPDEIRAITGHSSEKMRDNYTHRRAKEIAKKLQ